MTMKVDFALINATVWMPTGECRQNHIITIKNGKIAQIGHMNDIQFESDEIHNCRGNLVTPGLIDCHTHLVYAGDRARDFELKLQGVSYAEISKMGGGIQSTVNATQNASLQTLYDESLPRLEQLMAEGVTTVEIKSGYGLTLESERRLLQTARALAKGCKINIKTTFLGAHTIPQNFKNDSNAYVNYVCEQMMPVLAEEGLIDAVDVFCESIAFSLEQTEKIFIQAKKLNLPIKCHAEQLSLMGASQLASEYHALSCDHLEHIDETSIIAMQKSGSVAVLLPGAFYFLKETKKPPIELFRQHQVPMAIATDCNPGTSPTTSIQLMMNMACQSFGLTPTEALLGVTTHAAKALGMSDAGQLKVGASADIVCWGVSTPALLCYYVGSKIDKRILLQGQWQSRGSDI
jgi:imidazolonepropionase